LPHAAEILALAAIAAFIAILGTPIIAALSEAAVIIPILIIVLTAAPLIVIALTLLRITPATIVLIVAGSILVAHRVIPFVLD
jgi:hypothetical protein